VKKKRRDVLSAGKRISSALVQLCSPTTTKTSHSWRYMLKAQPERPQEQTFFSFLLPFKIFRFPNTLASAFAEGPGPMLSTESSKEDSLVICSSCLLFPELMLRTIELCWVAEDAAIWDVLTKRVATSRAFKQRFVAMWQATFFVALAILILRASLCDAARDTCSGCRSLVNGFKRAGGPTT
jgi:hypothetical protein